MEKNRFPVQILGILLILLPQSILWALEIPTLGKAKYVPFSSLQKSFSDLDSSLNRATLVGSIHLGNSEIRFRIGESFYTVDGQIEKTKLGVLYKDRDFLLPPEFVEAILVHLVRDEVLYTYKGQKFVFEIRAYQQAGKLESVIIDAGHGGKDPGTSSKKGIHEKEVVLDVALKLKARIEKERPDIRVFLTRSDDRFLELEDRSARANYIRRKYGISVFVSLHCNSHIAEESNGFEIYYLSQTATTESARQTALLENGILDERKNPKVKEIEADMMSSSIQRRSRILASTVEREMKKNLYRKILSRGVKKADFSVLRGSLMPAVLVEMGYLSNPKEARELQSSRIQEEICESILRGIEDYDEKTN